jgi:hypothetical protein
MPDVVLHIGESCTCGFSAIDQAALADHLKIPAGATQDTTLGHAKQPFICLEDFDQETGARTERALTRDILVPLPESQLRNFQKMSGDTAVRAMVGIALYDYLHSTLAGEEWIRECRKFDSMKEGSAPDPLRSYLHIEAEEYRHAPWEFMLASTDAFAPFRARNHRPVRGEPSTADDTHKIPIPLSVLVVQYDVNFKGLTDDEVSRVEPQAQIDAIHSALRTQPGMWQVDVLHKPKATKLKETLERLKPQILHFIGEVYGQEDPEFRATQQDGSRDQLKVSDLRAFGYDAEYEQPLLFILNGCWTANMASPEEFSKLGSKAVITNQATVFGSSATAFTEKVYEKLAQTGDVAKAVRDARAHLHNEIVISGQHVDQYHWGVPVLMTYGNPEKVLLTNLGDTAKQAIALIQGGDFGDPRLVFNHLDEIRQIWGRADSATRVALITGPPTAGKSTLLRTSMLTWKLRKHPAVLFDAWTERATDGHPVDKEKFLARLFEQLIMEYGQGSSAANELNMARAALNRDSDTDPYLESCRKLISILDRATREAPLLLGIDCIEDFFVPDLKGILGEQLFRRIALGDAGRTYLAVAVTPDKESRLGWSKWNSLLLERVKLGNFWRDDATRLAHEYGAKRGKFGNVLVDHGNQSMADWITTVAESRIMQGGWFPHHLTGLDPHPVVE